MTRILLLLLSFAVAGSLCACGTLEVGVETNQTPTPSIQNPATSTPMPTLLATSTPPPATFIPTGTVPPLTATPAPERITFPVGGTTFAFVSKLTTGVEQRYVLQILAQQKMTITTGSNVTITVLDSRNKILQPSASSPGLWQGTVPQTSDYIIVLRGQGLVTVTIEIPPRGS